MESAEIKRLRPFINRAQRVRNFPYVIHQYYNQLGYLCFATAQVTAKTRKGVKVIAQYPKMSRAKGHLSRIMNDFELCAKFCSLQNGTGPCFNYHIKQCHGACAELEDVEAYNERAIQAAELLSAVFEEDFFLLDKVRSHQEKSLILFENGNYKGFGYIDESELNGDPEQLRDSIRIYTGNPETTRIIQRYMSDNPGLQIIKLRQ